VAAHDLVISLIPHTQHLVVIKSAIKGKTHVITPGSATKELDAEAKLAGIVVLNEFEQPGTILHLSAIKTIEEVHAKGGKVY
jgi:saccharopine dehydrogenase-like NADP-dependent oxidoreductase